MTRGLVLVVGAVFVLCAVGTMAIVMAASDLANGIPLDTTYVASLAVFGAGAALVLGITGRAVWRERASTGWAAYGVVVAAAALAGIVGGATLGSRSADQHIAYVRDRARTTCMAFVRVHPMSEDECEAREMSCEGEVRAHPPVVSRGLGGVTTPIDPGAPTDPRDRAVWECMGGH